MSYIMQGEFALRGAHTFGFDEPEDMGVELSWGLWEQPTADNDDEWDTGPEAA